MGKKKIQSLEGQSVLDLAVQTAGSVEAAIEMSMTNDISVTDDIAPMALRTPDVRNKAVAGYYEARAITPATAVTEAEQIFEDVFEDTFK